MFFSVFFVAPFVLFLSLRLNSLLKIKLFSININEIIVFVIENGHNLVKKTIMIGVIRPATSIGNIL